MMSRCVLSDMSRVIRKTVVVVVVFFFRWENKGADQLRGSGAADKRVCFRYIYICPLYLNPNFHASSHLLWLYSPVCAGPDRNLKDAARLTYCLRILEKPLQMWTLLENGVLF